MDARTSPPGTAHGSSSRISFASMTSWWPQRWTPTFLASHNTPAAAFSSPLGPSDSSASFDVDDSSAPGTPAPSSTTTPPSVPGSFLTPLPSHWEKKAVSSVPRFASITPTTTLTASSGFKSEQPYIAAAPGEAKLSRFASAAALNGSAVSAAGEPAAVTESSACTTPRLSNSTSSTPRHTTPSLAPLSEEAYAVKPWSTMSAGVQTSMSVPVSARGAAPFLLPVSASLSDAFAADPKRHSPTCVERPGPQSLFIRSSAASGCDSRSIGLLQKSVLAEQLALPPSQP